MGDIIRRLPLDDHFREAMRGRIDVARCIDMLQNHRDNPVLYPLRKSQMDAIQLLLKKSLPDLIATEHKVITAPTERRTMIEKIVARATAQKQIEANVIEADFTPRPNGNGAAHANGANGSGNGKVKHR